MPPQPSTDLTLRAENAELRVRLEAAEQMLRAIRAGELSALVVEGDAAPRLCTLQGLEAEQNRLRGELLAQVSDAVIAVDTEERVTFLNAAAERQYGVRAGDVLGRILIEIFTPHWPSPEAEAGMRTALSERGAWRGALIHRRPDGSELHVETSASALHGPDGAGTGYVASIRDITERRQAEAALQLTNQRFDLAVKCSQVVLFQQDLELRYTWLQNAASGFEEPVAIGKRDTDLMERAADAAVTEVLKREVIRSGVSQRQEVLVQIQGVDRHFDLLVEPQRDSAGLISGVTCAAIDITERKRAVAEYRDAQRQIATTLESITDGFIRFDRDWRVVYVNAEAERIVRLTRAEMMGRSQWELFPATVGTKVEAEYKRAMAERVSVELENYYGPLDGWYLIRAYPAADGGLTINFQDITARKKAEQDLRVSNERLRIAKEAAALGIHAYEVKTGRIEWDDRVRALWGVSPDEPINYDTFLSGLHPDDKAAAQAAVDKALDPTGDGHYAAEYRVKNRIDGVVRSVAATGIVVFEGGEAVRLVGTVQDITARKQVEEELRLLASIVEYSRDFIGISDTHGTPVYGNRAAMELVGIKDLEQVRRSKIIDYFIPEQRQFIEEVVLPAVATDGRWAGELTMQHFVTGATFPVWYDLFRVDDHVTGQPVNFATITRDLTESKRVEQALAERTELLNGVLEGATDVIFVKDLNGRCLMANTACAAVLSSTPEQVVGKTTEELCPPDLAAAVRQHDEAVIAGGLPIQLEETILVAGEARVFLTLKAPLRDGSSRVVGVLGISRDITERKRIELNLTHAIAVAEKANRAKSDFLSSMSHELRTPLNAILGFAQLMGSGTPAPTPVQKRSLDQILKGGWYLLDLINELLDLALVESGKLSLTLEPVSLAEVMLECQAMIEPQAHTCGIDMTFPSFEVAYYVHADRTRVQQVVINLLSNAIKYNKAQGAVAVEWTLIPPDAIRISVRDTGEGLAPEKLAQLFQPFNRLGQETGPQVGTGIGLVTTKRLVELMGGAIGVDSVVGVGSVFWFELKRASAPQSARGQV